MSNLYFIDGNNLLHATDRWNKFPRSDQRPQLIRTLEDDRPTGSIKNSVTVVFDGHVPKSGAIKSESIKIIFSGDKDADTIIRESVDELSHPRSAIVVTNDRSIRLHVRKKGAKVLSCEEFLAMGKKKQKIRSDERLDASALGEINEELKNIWKD